MNVKRLATKISEDIRCSTKVTVSWSSVHRLASAWLVAALVIGTATPIFDYLAHEQTYRLAAPTASLLGHNTNLASKLTYDKKTEKYRFNASATDAANKDLASADPSTTPNPATGGVPDEVKAQLAMQQKVGAADKKDKQLYGVDLPVKAANGITFTDTNSKLSFTLTPQFGTDDARVVDGRVVYPVSGTSQQAVYSLKNNGLKEDIILTAAPESGSVEYTYTLNLPDSLVAKVLPNGGIGIYSADPALFGEISAGTPEDQKAIDAARKNAAKDYLVCGLPLPVIHQTGSAAAVTTAQAKFELDGNTLRVKASNLANLSYPVSVDPSVVVTSTADFATGNNEGNIDFTTGNQINRGTLTGGTTAAWAAGNAFTTARTGHASVAYNGYLYVLGGCPTNACASPLNTVEYASVNSSNGVLTWLGSPGNFTTARGYLSSIAYNGYLYVLGGYTGSTPLNTVEYASINSSTGALTWTTSPAAGNFTTARFYHASVVYNGYLYVLGGTTNFSTPLNSVEYAKINANGTLTWNGSAGSFTTARLGLASVAYNGYLYVLGGINSGSTPFNSVEYATINASGTLTWNGTTNAFSTTRYGHTSVIYNGYLYVMGGYSGSTALNTVEYATINANGTLTWNGTTNTFTTTRYSHSSVAYNGYLYVMGGYNGSVNNTVQYAKINPAGVLADGTWPTGNAFTTFRTSCTSVAYNGYLYVIGGYNGTGVLNTVEYATINANGTLTWNGTTGSFTTARSDHTSVAYNGYLYVIGGTNSTGNTINSVEYATINSSGTLTWNGTTNAFTTARSDHTSVVYNGYLYVIGGYNGSSALNTVQYATISSNGTLTWAATNSFTTARESHTSVAYNGRLYVIGGTTNGSTPLNSVEYATINANGTLTWNGTTNAFTTARFGHTSVVYNGCLYVIGGTTGSLSVLNSVEYATINSNGTLTWNGTTTAFSTARAYHASVVYNGYVYVLGGEGGTGEQLNTVEYQRINNGGPGTTGTWADGNAGASFTNVRYGHTTVAYNGFMYVIGGYNPTGTPAYYNDIQYAPINTSGTIGSWVTNSTSFTNARRFHSSVVYNGYLYVTGGNNGATYYNDTQYALVCTGSNNGVGGCGATAGTVGTWNTASNSFTNARARHSSVTYNGYLYVIGGQDGSGNYSDVQYSAIGSNGNLGTWGSTNSFSVARYGHTSVAYNGYLYVVGGTTDGTTPNNRNDVQLAIINTNGTVGTWVNTTAFPKSRYGHISVACNGYLYVMGGNGSGLFFNDVQLSPINTNGTLGDWNTTTSFTTGRSAASTAIYNGYVYVLGGSDAISSAINTIQFAPLNVQPRVGQYSRLIDLGSDQVLNGLVYNGTLLGNSGGGAVNLTVRTATSASPAFGAATTYTNVAPGATTTLTGTFRYVLIVAKIDDSNAGAFADSVIGQTFITDLTLNYTALITYGNPGARLFNGKFFSNGVLQPLNPQ